MAVVIEELEVIEPPAAPPPATAAAPGAGAQAGAEIDAKQLDRALERRQWQQMRLHAD